MSQPTHSGIVTDETGQRHIPESTRADGSTRKAIKIRPGYEPPEDKEKFKARTAEAFRNRGKGGVPGAEDLKQNKPEAPSATSNKNAKRREARKKAKAAAAAAESADTTEKKAAEVPEPNADAVDPQVEKDKKARNLKKKLKQARELKNKKDGGESLLPEQFAKVIKINELIRELEALGFNADGEPVANSTEDNPQDESTDAPA